MNTEQHKTERLTIVLHSGEMDKLYSALIIANGALAMGMEASIFCTFWGLQRLRKDAVWTMPVAGLDKGPLSKMNMLGIGKWMINQRMKRINVASLETLMADFIELGGKVMACDMTMDIMGIRKKDLREDLISEYCGVGSFIQEARDSTVSLFI
ncbi:MAG TPA: DsrE/DsrF/DrsH-like family protein [Anaerolineae bacterium]|nr:DsrE/DsrF/DrsH-like family protein [Anaerolineae bacterium]